MNFLPGSRITSGYGRARVSRLPGTLQAGRRTHGPGRRADPAVGRGSECARGAKGRPVPQRPTQAQPEARPASASPVTPTASTATARRRRNRSPSAMRPRSPTRARTARAGSSKPARRNSSRRTPPVCRWSASSASASGTARRAGSGPRAGTRFKHPMPWVLRRVRSVPDVAQAAAVAPAHPGWGCRTARWRRSFRLSSVLRGVSSNGVESDAARWLEAPFPHPAHRTVLADFPHTALGQGLMRSLTRSCVFDPPGGSGPEFGGGMRRGTVTSLDPPPGASDTASDGAFAARGRPPRGRPC